MGTNNNLPPVPLQEIGENYHWRDFFRRLQAYIANVQNGGTVWGIAQGGTGAGTASQARSNLGIGSLGAQDANTVAITGGSVKADLSGSTIPLADVTGAGTMASQNIGATGTFVSGSHTLTITNGIVTRIT